MGHRSSRRSDDSSSSSSSSSGSSDESGRASESGSSGSDESDKEALLDAHSSTRHHHKERAPKKHKKHHRRSAAAGAAYAQREADDRSHHNMVVGFTAVVVILVVLGLGFGAYKLFNSGSMLAGSSTTSTAATPTAQPSTVTAMDTTTNAETVTASPTAAATATDETATAIATGASTSSAASTRAGGAESGKASGSATGTASKASGSGSATAAKASGTSTAAKSSESATKTTSNASQIIAGWWPAWSSTGPTGVDWSKYTVGFYFAAYPTTSTGALSYDAYQTSFPSDFVTAVQSGGAKAVLTVGGWDGSNYFTTLVATNDSRSGFITILQEAISTYGFDGLDFDWEYPGKAGDTDDYSADDFDNYLLFLQEVRAAMGSDFWLSAAAGSLPWVDSTGSPSADVSGYADVLDYIELMLYDSDVGPDSGPNFPLVSSCAPTGSAWAYSVEYSINQWIAAKFPANQIILGMGAYGHIWNIPDFSSTAGVGQVSSSTVYQSETGSDTSVVMLFSEMDSLGWLDGSNSSVTQTFDNCTSTPFVYDSGGKILVPYDDPTSIAAKCSFGKALGTIGAAVYPANGDSNNVFVEALIANC